MIIAQIRNQKKKKKKKKTLNTEMISALTCKGSLKIFLR